MTQYSRCISNTHISLADAYPFFAADDWVTGVMGEKRPERVTRGERGAGESDEADRCGVWFRVQLVHGCCRRPAGTVGPKKRGEQTTAGKGYGLRVRHLLPPAPSSLLPHYPLLHSKLASNGAEHGPKG